MRRRRNSSSQLKLPHMAAVAPQALNVEQRLEAVGALRERLQGPAYVRALALARRGGISVTALAAWLDALTWLPPPPVLCRVLRDAGRDSANAPFAFSAATLAALENQWLVARPMAKCRAAKCLPASIRGPLRSQLPGSERTAAPSPASRSIAS